MGRHYSLLGRGPYVALLYGHYAPQQAQLLKVGPFLVLFFPDDRDNEEVHVVLSFSSLLRFHLVISTQRTFQRARFYYSLIP